MSFEKKSFPEIRDAVLDDITSGGLITDRNVGSVTRTLVEAYTRELATLYESLQNVYDSAFVDTATGKSLEFVVSILGIERIQAGRAEGTATFSRQTPAEGDITIPKGTIITRPRTSADEVVPLFETTEIRTLKQGESEIEVPIRAQEAGDPGVAGSHELTVLPRPIVGIEAVTNREPATLRVRTESDEELRQRAKNALRNSGKATRDALEFSLRRLGVQSVEIVDCPGGRVGEIDIIVDGKDLEDPRLEKEIRKIIHDTKAAGITYNLNFAKRVHIFLKLALKLKKSVLIQEELDNLLEDVRLRIETYISSLEMGEIVRRNGIVNAVLGNQRILEVEFLPFDDGTPDLYFRTGRVENDQRIFEEIPKVRKRALDSGDIFIDRQERAVLEKRTDLIANQDLIIKERKFGVFIDFEDDGLILIGDSTVTQSRVLDLIRSNIQIFLQDIEKQIEQQGRPITSDYKSLQDLLQIEGYTIEQSNLKVILLHEFNGLEITLRVPGERGTIDVNEAAQLKNLNLQINIRAEKK